MVPLTPRNIVIAARVGLVAGVAAVVSYVFVAPRLSPVALILGGSAASLLTLLAFPRVRRNELLVAVATCGALTGCLRATGWTLDTLATVASGVAGPAIVAMTLSVIRVRNLAASNAHMSFVEWRQFDRRSKHRGEEIKAKTEQVTHASRWW